MLVEKWAQEWLDTYKGSGVSTETYNSYVYCLKSNVYPHIGKMPLKSVKPIHLQKILLNLAGYSADHISKVHYTIKQIFKTAFDNNLLSVDPSAKLSPPKGTNGTRRALTENERAHILRLCQTHRAGLWIELMLFCGLRPAEAGALQWRHIDFKKETLRIEQSLKRSGGVGSTKTSAGNRTVPIPKPLLNDLLAKRGDPFEYVITNTYGNRVTSTSMQRMWQSFKNDLNIEMGCLVVNGKALPPYKVAPDLVPYCFRHTYCTDLQAAGVPINVAKELMGHSDISVTAKIYTHYSQIAFDNAAAAINEHQRKVCAVG